MGYGKQPVVNQNVNWVTDEDGNVVGFERKPGDLVAVGRAAPFREAPIRVATFGDSTAAGLTIGGAFSATQDTAVLSASYPAAGNNSSATLTQPYATNNSHVKYFLVFDGGIGGTNTTTQLARSTATASATRRSIEDGINTGIDVAIIRTGINDIASLTAASTPAQILSLVDQAVSNVKEIITRFLTSGARVIFYGLYGYSMPSKAADFGVIRPALLSFNEKIKSFCAEYDDVAYIDTLNVTHTSDGAWIPGLSYDGLHPGFGAAATLKDIELMVLTDWFGRPPGIRYHGKNYFRNSSFFEETPGNGGLGAGNVFPAGYATFVTAGSFQNAKIEVIDGQNWATLEVVPNATVNSATPCVPGITLPFNLANMMTAAGVGATSIIGVEFDILLMTLDGTGVDAIIRSHTMSIAKTGAGNFQHSATASQGYVISPLPKITKYMKRIVFNPVLINEPIANINGASCQLFSTWNIYEQKTVKVGVSSPRAVFLDQVVFNK